MRDRARVCATSICASPTTGCRATTGTSPLWPMAHRPSAAASITRTSPRNRASSSDWRVRSRPAASTSRAFGSSRTRPVRWCRARPWRSTVSPWSARQPASTLPPRRGLPTRSSWAASRRHTWRAPCVPAARDSMPTPRRCATLAWGVICSRARGWRGASTDRAGRGGAPSSLAIRWRARPARAGTPATGSGGRPRRDSRRGSRERWGAGLGEARQ